MKKGFTLIELLIVVAIIAILAAIAVPNFLEAQTRAKVSRAKADMRSMATAVESYYVDTNHAWPDANDMDGNFGTGTGYVDGWPQNVAVERPGTPLDLTVGPQGDMVDSPIGSNQRWSFRTYANWNKATTPVAYTTTIPIDPFSIAVPLAYEQFVSGGGTAFVIISSVGPDKAMNTPGSAYDEPDYDYPNLCYDPTNGTVSVGDIFRPICPINLGFAKTRFGDDFVFAPTD